MERTYTGPLPRGVVTLPDNTRVEFVRGVPVEFTAEQAKALDDEWTTPKSKAAQAATPSEED